MPRLLPKLLLLALTGAALSGCGKSAPSEFDQHLNTYLRTPEDPGPSERGKYKLKIIPVDMTGKRIDAEVYHLLPEWLRASKPSEVGTVVQIFWKEVPIDQGRTIFKPEVRMVDLETNKVRYSMGAGQGPASKYRNRRGSKPVEVVADTIRQLTENLQKQ
jgi:hypothetical protein